MEEYVLSVLIQLIIVMYVHQQQNAQHVPIHIIQRIMELVVHYVHRRNVHHVMHQVESVQHVKQDII